MGTLTITNETKGINYSFIHEGLKLNGDANLGSNNFINTLNGQIYLSLDTMEYPIGNYNINSININDNKFTFTEFNTIKNIRFSTLVNSTKNNSFLAKIFSSIIKIEI